MYTMLSDQTLTRGTVLRLRPGSHRQAQPLSSPVRGEPGTGYLMTHEGRRLYPFAQPGGSDGG